MGNRPVEAETLVAEDVDGPAEIAMGRPAGSLVVVPTAAAEYPVGVPFGFFNPGTTIVWGSIVIVMPVIFNPFSDIPVHVVKIVFIGIFAGDRMRGGTSVFIVPGMFNKLSGIVTK